MTYKNAFKRIEEKIELLNHSHLQNTRNKGNQIRIPTSKKNALQK